MEGFPLHESLDKVSPNNPVLLTHASGHASFGAQLPSVNLGVAGVLLAGAGDVVYLVGTRRLLRRRMGRLPAGLGRRMPGAPGEGGEA